MDRGEPVYQTFRKYNPTTGVTTPLTQMPFKSYHARSVQVGNMVYTLGGCGLSGATTQYCSDRHKRFAVYNTGATNLNIDETISACNCQPGFDECGNFVTLKYGRDLTTIKNSNNEAFSSNATCANKQISLSQCSLTQGAVQSGTSPSGNKLYTWPKVAS